MERKIKIPTKSEKRLAMLETENADLWYENVLLKDKDLTNEQEIADLWYKLLVGGNA